MPLTEDQKSGLGVALNEAAWLGISINEESHQVALGFRVLALPADSSAQRDDTIVTLLLSGVTRIAASLRSGRWDDPRAEVMPLTIELLPEVVRSFGGSPIYGWDFIDPAEDAWRDWRNRLSFDATVSDVPSAQVIELFQESGSGVARHLDFRAWFGELQVFDDHRNEIALEEFIAAGVRWWEGLHAGDPQTQGHGIVSGARSSRSLSSDDG